MGMFKFLSFAIASSLLCLAFLCPSHAQNTPQDFLNAHNAARGQVGVGPMLWDEKLASYASGYANKNIGDCKMVHSGGPYGENMALSTAAMSGTEAVKLWVDERASYNYNSNTCEPGKVCGQYTQAVWRSSVRLGCAKVRCNNGGMLIICSYDPPGNFIGQRPY